MAERDEVVHVDIGAADQRGIRIRAARTVHGRERQVHVVVTLYEPGRRITIKSVESTFPIEFDRVVVPTGPESCRLTAVITGGPQGTIAGLVGPFVGRMAQNSINRDYDRLVEVLESGIHR